MLVQFNFLNLNFCKEEAALDFSAAKMINEGYMIEIRMDMC